MTHPPHHQSPKSRILNVANMSFNIRKWKYNSRENFQISITYHRLTYGTDHFSANNKGLIVFNILINRDISSDIWSKIKFYNDVLAEL